MRLTGTGNGMRAEALVWVIGETAEGIEAPC